jgi:hypothetical protein
MWNAWLDSCPRPDRIPKRRPRLAPARWNRPPWSGPRSFRVGTVRLGALLTSRILTWRHRARARPEPPRRPRSRDRRAGRGGDPAPVRQDPDDRLGELRVDGRARGHRHRLHQQVLRGLRRQALLRGPAGRRPARAARHRARQGAVRRRARQRADLLGLAGEPRRLPRIYEPRRHRAVDVAGPRRPPDARLAGLGHRQVVQAHARRPAGSTWTTCARSRCASGPR